MDILAAWLCNVFRAEYNRKTSGKGQDGHDALRAYFRCAVFCNRQERLAVYWFNMDRYAYIILKFKEIIVSCWTVECGR
jgi:hypothetical protein